MKTGIIMPTINVPTNLDEWTAMLDRERGDFVVVVGNGKTPHTQVEKYLSTLPVDAMYMHPADEVSHRWAIDEFLALNHHHRRNLALLQALTNKPDLIVTIDDDNYPFTSNWLDSTQRLFTDDNARPVIYADTGWWNPGSLCDPAVTHRGYPISQRLVDSREHMLSPRNERIGVLASLWRGDPDIDAIERIALDPQVRSITQSVTLAPKTWAPFDSQSTAVIADLAPMLYMWTDVGRYDDIWASYLMRTVMDPLGWHVTYGHPTVRQDRNEHDLLKDLDAELFGLRYTEQLCDALRRISEEIYANVKDGDGSTTPWEWFKYAVESVDDECNGFLPMRTLEGLHAWVQDVDSIGIE